MAHSAATQRRIVLLLAVACLACAPAGREGEAIDIAEESAIILWDAAAKTQHFIRRASFETKAKDFGFLVPTPTAPKLAEADDEAFGFLDQLTSPRLPPLAAEVKKGEPVKAAAKAEVVVIERVKVAGYDAAVLAANDAGALDEWLKQNGYVSTPELAEWTKAYIEKRWIITAFKIAGGGPAPRTEASAVRMSFTTEQPFFPYREPAAAKSGGPRDRLLRVYFLGEFRPEGKIGAADAWPGRVAWSDTISVPDRDRLAKLLKLPDPLPDGMRRLTRFSDGSSPRPGSDDLYFNAAADQGLVPDPKEIQAMEEKRRALHRKAQREQWLTIAVVVLLIFAGIFTYARYGSKK